MEEEVGTNEGQQAEGEQSNSPKIQSAKVLQAGASVAGKFGGPTGKAISVAAKSSIGRGVINAAGNAIDGAVSKGADGATPGQNLMNNVASKMLPKSPGLGSINQLSNHANMESDIKDAIQEAFKDEAKKKIKKQVLQKVILPLVPYLIVGGLVLIIVLIIIGQFASNGNDLSATHRNPYLMHESCYNYDGTRNNLCQRGDETPGEGYSVYYDPKLLELFPNGVPSSSSEMKKYLEKITVLVKDKNGNDKEFTLQVHRDLASTFQSIFQDLYAMNFPIDTANTYVFNWRTKRQGTSMSMHAYGIAIDINPKQNGGVYGPDDPDSPLFVTSEVVDVFSKYGFFWGGYWSEKYRDPMHFSYINQ